jgi:hypothetical protein
MRVVASVLADPGSLDASRSGCDAFVLTPGSRHPVWRMTMHANRLIGDFGTAFPINLDDRMT